MNYERGKGRKGREIVGDRGRGEKGRKTEGEQKDVCVREREIDRQTEREREREREREELLTWMPSDGLECSMFSRSV